MTKLSLMEFFSPVRPLLKGLLVSVIAFGLLAFALVGQFALAVSMPLEEGLRMAARDWLPWAVLAPLIFRLVRKLPVERERWKIAIPVHLGCAIGIVALCTFWAESMFPPKPWAGVRRLDPRPREGSVRSGAESPPAPSRGAPRRGAPSRRSFSTFFLIGFRLPIYLAIVSVAHAVYFYQRGQSRERRALELEASLAQSRLEALKMQVQPHFLFNSLNAISALVHQDAERADEMIDALSDFLRLTLESSAEQEVPLERELEFVERYLRIEKVRFGDRLQVKIDAHPETLRALVPSLVLQPLVENAIRHGLEPHPRTGIIAIEARRYLNQLILSIADNGGGLGGDEGRRREGIGLTNTRARLHALYGTEATFELQELDGVRAVVTLPYHTFT